MQMKYLSLALAAALATTLTACGGSDNKSNYNKDTLTPVQPGNGGDVKPGEGDKKPGEGDKKPGEGDKKPGEGDKPEGGKDDGKDDGKTPTDGGSIDNPGNSVYDGKATSEPSVMSGNYRRGAQSAYDREKNPDQQGNSTAISYTELQNKEMTNIVFGRESGDIKDRAETWYRYVGQDGSAPNPKLPGSLQSWNTLPIGKNGEVAYYQTQAIANKNGETTYKVTAEGIAQDIYQPQDSLRGTISSSFGQENEHAFVSVGAQKAQSDIVNFTNQLESVTNDLVLDKSNNKLALGAGVNNSSAKELIDFLEKINRNTTTKDNVGDAIAEINQKLLDDASASLADLSDPAYSVSNVSVYGEFADTNNNIRRKQANNGLVAILSTANTVTRQGRTTVIGQEDQEVQTDPVNTVLSVKTYGQNSPTRIFGANYSTTDRETVNGRLVNRAKTEANSWVYIPQKIVAIPQNNLNAYKKVGPRDNKPENASSTLDQIGKKSALVGYASSTAIQNIINNTNKSELLAALDDGSQNDPYLHIAALQGNANNDLEKGTYGLAATATKLDHVQYGRVTNNIDPVENDIIDVLTKGRKGQAYIYAPFRNKFNYNLGDIVGETNNATVDTYFYRGTGETSLEDMAKLPQNATYVYNGHAITYGVDNSFHGSKGLGKSNSFTFGKDKVGLGNFVQAKYDVGAKKVEGFIYNVFLTDKEDAKSGYIDKLIEFNGNVVGNTIPEGKANLTYKDSTGSFTGSFYGKSANELGGAVNSLDDAQFGKKEWGAVFGAKRTVGTGNQVQYD